MNADERISFDQLASLLRLPSFAPGWVWLAGAGPGEPGLITVLGAHAIAHADVILYDALVNEALFSLAAPEAQIVFAGKRGGKPSASQDEITRELIEFARRKKRVLRLKGGDPFVFGRGGEEALALARVGIPFRVVPGLTAGIGGLAYAGIPVTHRDTNHAVTFVTGHGRDGNLPALDWDAIAKGSPTIVLYMALAHINEIVQKLIAAGRSANEPAAIVSNASLKDQDVCVTTLGELAAKARESRKPAIFIIGENVRLRTNLDWLPTKR